MFIAFCRLSQGVHKQEVARSHAAPSFNRAVKYIGMIRRTSSWLRANGVKQSLIWLTLPQRFISATIAFNATLPATLAQSVYSEATCRASHEPDDASGPDSRLIGVEWCQRTMNEWSCSGVVVSVYPCSESGHEHFYLLLDVGFVPVIVGLVESPEIWVEVGTDLAAPIHDNVCRSA